MSLADVAARGGQPRALPRRRGRRADDGGHRRRQRGRRHRWAASSRCSRSAIRPVSAATCRATCVCAPGSPAACSAVPAIMGVEFGLGFAAAGLPGSQVHDPIAHDPDRGYVRASNRSGGIEGGISNGADDRRARRDEAHLHAGGAAGQRGDGIAPAVKSRFERSDVCAVPAVGIVLEAVVALTLADAALDRFGGATVRRPRRRGRGLPAAHQGALRAMAGRGEPDDSEPGRPEGARRAAVALVGFMGAGKSAVGRELAAALGIPFADTDDLVVAARRPDRRHLRGARRGRRFAPWRRRSSTPRIADAARAAVRAGAGRRRRAGRRRAGGAQAPAARRLARRAGRGAVGARAGAGPGGAAARRRRGVVRRAARRPASRCIARSRHEVVDDCRRSPREPRVAAEPRGGAIARLRPEPPPDHAAGGGP